MKILILKRDKIGDMLLVTPMLEHLRISLPQARIHMLANDYNAWVLDGNRDIDHCWIYPRVRHGASVRPLALFEQLWQLRKLRHEKFDVAIAAGGVVSPRAVARILKLGARRTIAYAGAGPDADDPVFRRLSDPLPYDRALHEVLSNLRLLTPLGVAMPQAPIYPRYRPGRAWRESGDEWLAAHGLQPGKFIVIGLNARRPKRKPDSGQILRWARHFKDTLGLHSVLIWQPGPANDRVYPGDDEIVAPLMDQMPPYLKPFANPEDVRGALGVIWQAATSIFPDGGIAHLASVSPGGVLALFAETDVSPHPDNWRPYARRATYLEARKTVAELSDQQVFERVDWLLAQALQE